MADFFAKIGFKIPCKIDQILFSEQCYMLQTSGLTGFHLRKVRSKGYFDQSRNKQKIPVINNKKKDKHYQSIYI